MKFSSAIETAFPFLLNLTEYVVGVHCAVTVFVPKPLAGMPAGDVFCGTVAVVSKVRDNCYVDSESLCQQIRMRYADLSAYCQTVKRGIPSAGDRLEFKVVSVSQLPSRIDLKLEIIG